MTEKIKKLAIFGGSFSPPHVGHVNAALAFLRATEAERLLVIPSGTHPCKGKVEDASGAHRAEMCRIAFERDPRFCGKCSVSLIELSEDGISYTCNTVKRLEAEADEIFMLVGADVVKNIENWKDFRDILSRVTLCVATRGGEDISGYCRYLQMEYGARTELVSVSEDASSGGARDAARSGRPLWDLVPYGVEAYITEHRLYGARKMTYEERYSEEALCELRAEIKSKMSEKRFSHTLGVERKVVELCGLYAPEKTGMLRAAALLHDVTKEIKTPEQIALCEKYGVVYDSDVLAAPKLFHSITAAAIIPHKFPRFAVPELIRAVSVHTGGAEDMNICDKILYLADYIEDTRTFEDCVELRRQFDCGVAKAKNAEELEDVLDRTMLTSFDMTIKDLISEERPVAAVTVRSRNAMLRKCRK